MSTLFRSWGLPKSGKDPELERLEQETAEAKEKIQELRAQGRQRRQRHKESIEALETKKMTLDEILNRMDQELMDKNVDDYADTLAEVFGERKIFAHRAIGLEALLCQFMHQMLGKQHQLKIMKRLGKDIQKRFQKVKSYYRDEFHSYEILSVKCETMRLSLEAQYDDIFAAQHALLAQLHHVEAGGTMTNYKIVKAPQSNDEKKNKKKSKKPSLKVSTKHQGTPQGSKTPQSNVDFGESDDDDALMNDVLSTPKASEIKAIRDKNENEDGDTSKRPSSTGSGKSPRDRRREIEQQRLASGRGHRTSTGQFGAEEETEEVNGNDSSSKNMSVRERMRALEAKVSKDSPEKKEEEGLKVRKSSSKKSPRRSTTEKSDSSTPSKSSKTPQKSPRQKDFKAPAASPNGKDEDEARRRRRERRKEKSASRISATG